MKLKQIITGAAALALITAFAGPVFAGDEKEEAISMDKVPKAVKETLAKYATEAEVKKIEKGDQDGKTVYEFDIEQGKKKFELAISPKGKFMGTEEEVEFSAIPESAQKTLTDRAAGGKILSCEKAVDAREKVTYEAVIEKNGKKMEVTVTEKGKYVSSEKIAEKKESKEGKEGKEAKEEKEEKE